MSSYTRREWQQEQIQARASALQGDILGMDVQLEPQASGRVLWLVTVGVEVMIDTEYGEEYQEESVEFDGWLDEGGDQVLAEIWDAVQIAAESSLKVAA